MIVSLHDNWEFAETAPGSFADPSMLQDNHVDWMPAVVPGTVAQSLAALNKPADIHFDDNDYWYRCQFTTSIHSENSMLQFDGLATLADVWLNGEKILSTDNMFVRYYADISSQLLEKNQLVICFRSITQALKAKKPRPKWKTRLIANQQLRWIRTTLLGRIPGWSAMPAAVGPWRHVKLRKNDTLGLDDISIITRVVETCGVVDIRVDATHLKNKNKKYIFEIDKQQTELSCVKTDDGEILHGQIKISNVKLWWPHTHGEPFLYTSVLSIRHDDDIENIPLYPAGFKDITIDTPTTDFIVKVNDKRVFCRGACWSINDITSLTGSPETLEQTLILMRNAGANMIRIGGTMVYEQDLFYQLCDKLGIMVWQDFMFANMNYPVDDNSFLQSVSCEVTQTLNRLSKHICISVYCGNSEIEQQAAMLGMDKSIWRNSLFAETIPDLCEQHHPTIPYIPSTPSEGTLPFHVNQGVSHYYGVGAYRRPVSETRQHDVKFTSECLGFANIPVAKTRNSVLNGDIPVTHDPRWKANTPRDSGTGWDFEDVRDHYMKTFYSVDPVELRSFNPQRYIELSETTTGEVMAQVFAEWRSSGSHCNGGLIWFLKDLWPGAGWGILDSFGAPKACYYYLKRIWQPIAIFMTSESIHGVNVHIANESQEDIAGVVELTLLQDDHIVIAQATREVMVAAGTTQTYQSDDLLNAFYDVAYSYRFGAPKHNVVAVRLLNMNNDSISDNYLFPLSDEPKVNSRIYLRASADKINANTYTLEINSDTFLYGVNIEVPGYLADLNFFHLMPEKTKHIRIKKMAGHVGDLKGYVSALNISEPVKITVNKK